MLSKHCDVINDVTTHHRHRTSAERKYDDVLVVDLQSSGDGLDLEWWQTTKDKLRRGRQKNVAKCQREKQRLKDPIVTRFITMALVMSTQNLSTPPQRL